MAGRPSPVPAAPREGGKSRAVEAAGLRASGGSRSAASRSGAGSLPAAAAIVRALAALLLAAALPTCGGGERAHRQEAPYQIGGTACLRALVARGLPAEGWSPSRRGGRSCAVNTPVRAAAGASARFTPALETSCAMLVAWSDVEADMQRAARRHLGQPVRSVYHYGSHSCRAMAGNAGRLSLHATARALDVSGFELADGTVVTVEEGWRGPRRQRRFLRAVRDAACRRQGVVLSPDRDRRHRDHLHLDIGPWRLCG